VGLFKTELTERRGPWLSLEQLELEVARWVEWYNQRRLHEACDYLPPAEFEAPSIYKKSAPCRFKWVSRSRACQR